MFWKPVFVAQRKSLQYTLADTHYSTYCGAASSKVLVWLLLFGTISIWQIDGMAPIQRLNHNIMALQTIRDNKNYHRFQVSCSFSEWNHFHLESRRNEINLIIPICGLICVCVNWVYVWLHYAKLSSQRQQKLKCKVLFVKLERRHRSLEAEWKHFILQCIKMLQFKVIIGSRWLFKQFKLNYCKWITLLKLKYFHNFNKGFPQIGFWLRFK